MGVASINLSSVSGAGKC